MYIFIKEMITNIELELLKSYKDKAYIMSLLCEQSYNHYSFVKNLKIGRAHV